MIYLDCGVLIWLVLVYVCGMVVQMCVMLTIGATVVKRAIRTFSQTESAALLLRRIQLLEDLKLKKSSSASEVERRMVCVWSCRGTNK